MVGTPVGAPVVAAQSGGPQVGIAIRYYLFSSMEFSIDACTGQIYTKDLTQRGDNPVRTVRLRTGLSALRCAKPRGDYAVFPGSGTGCSAGVVFAPPRSHSDFSSSHSQRRIPLKSRRPLWLRMCEKPGMSRRHFALRAP